MLQSLRTRFASEAPAAVTGAAAQKQGLVLLDDITCGAHYAALNTAIVGSGFNALCKQRRFVRPSALRNHIPNPPSARLSWGRLMQEMGQPDSISVRVSSFFTHLAVVEQQVEFICSEVEAKGQGTAATLHTARMMQASRQMSELAVAAVTVLDGLAQVTMSTFFKRNTVFLNSLLRDVLDGASPLIDRDGRINVLELPERRAPSRKRVQIPCVVECRAKESTGFVSNISAGGVGIENATGLAPRSTVVVEIGERCFAGIVVWQRGTSVGIKFDRPLKESDPLLAS